MLGHRLAEDRPVRVVMPEGQGIFALRPLVGDRPDVAEKPLAHSCFSLVRPQALSPDAFSRETTVGGKR